MYTSIIASRPLSAENILSFALIPSVPILVLVEQLLEGSLKQWRAVFLPIAANFSPSSSRPMICLWCLLCGAERLNKGGGDWIQQLYICVCSRAFKYLSITLTGQQLYIDVCSRVS